MPRREQEKVVEMNEIEIDLTKGQADYEFAGNCCAHCRKWIKKDEDSVRVEVNYESVWVHLDCFMEMCKKILERSKQNMRVQFT
jgi:translation initiation factor IF-3